MDPHEACARWANVSTGGSTKRLVVPDGQTNAWEGVELGSGQ